MPEPTRSRSGTPAHRSKHHRGAREPQGSLTSLVSDESGAAVDYDFHLGATALYPVAASWLMSAEGFLARSAGTCRGSRRRHDDGGSGQISAATFQDVPTLGMRPAVRFWRSRLLLRWCVQECVRAPWSRSMDPNLHLMAGVFRDSKTAGWNRIFVHSVQ